MTKLNELLNKYAGQIALVIFAIFVMWLKTLFVPKEIYNFEQDKHAVEVELLKSQVVTLQHEKVQLQNAVDVGTRRLQTYIDESKLAEEARNVLENKLIRLETIEECKEKWLYPTQHFSSSLDNK